MCAILDANVVHKVFGKNRPEAGKAFFEWLVSGNGSLVTGGKLHRELTRVHAFMEWSKQAVLSGKIKRFNDRKIDDRTERLKDSCISDDAHVIALAQISGARFLYSDEGNLHKDFKNKRLIDDPRGTIYSTKDRDSFTSGHRNLLHRSGICGGLLPDRTSDHGTPPR